MKKVVDVVDPTKGGHIAVTMSAYAVSTLVFK